MNLAERLKSEREKRNLTQQDLADKLHISRQSISKWETGQAYPDLEKIIELSDIYKISLDELVKGDVILKKKLIKDGKKFLWYEDHITRRIGIVFWGMVIPFIFILKYVVHI